MVLTAVACAVIGIQSPGPTMDPGSFYGMRTYTNNAEFVCMPEKLAVGFAPENTDDLTLHFLKEDGTEVVGKGVYSDDTKYPAFKILRISSAEVRLTDSGKYRGELRHKGTPVSVFPFEIVRKMEGDEFNPTYFWDFRTPVDKMGTLSFSNTEADATVWVTWWNAPRREGIPMKSSATMALYHNGKKIASGTPVFYQEPQNQRWIMRMDTLKGFEQFRKASLLKLGGVVEGRLMTGEKALRTFKWTIEGGKVQPIARSQSGYEPRTEYWMPRSLAGTKQGYQFYHLEEQYWATSE
jgi:hypothetical protein